MSESRRLENRKTDGSADGVASECSVNYLTVKRKILFFIIIGIIIFYFFHTPSVKIPIQRYFTIYSVFYQRKYNICLYCFLKQNVKKCECRFLNFRHPHFYFFYDFLIHMVHNQRIVFLNHGIRRWNDGLVASFNHDYLFCGRKIKVFYFHTYPLVALKHRHFV